VSVRVTTPAKLFNAVIVIVEVADWPALTAAGEDAAIVKSTKWKVTVVEFVAPVAVAVTVSTSFWFDAEVHVRTDVPPAGMVIVVTLSRQDEPPVAATERVTVFANPPRAATVIVEVPPGDPTFAVTLVGLALRLIPPATGTLTVTEMAAVELVIRLFVPPVPVIATE
jgi:hypothetical protein